MYKMLWVADPKDGTGGVLDDNGEITAGGIPARLTDDELNRHLDNYRDAWPVLIIFDASKFGSEWLQVWRSLNRWWRGEIRGSVTDAKRSLLSIVDRPWFKEADIPYQPDDEALCATCPALWEQD